MRWIPLLMLLALGAMWGGNPNFSKALGIEGISPPAIVFWQTLGAGSILLAVCAIRRIPLPLDRKALIYYAFIGWVCIDMAYMTVVIVVRHIPVGSLAVITVLSPLLTYVFAIVLQLERPQILRVTGILIGLGGVAVLVLPRGSLPSEDALPYALLGLLVPAGYAAGNVFAEIGRPKGADNVALAAGTMIFANIGGGVIALANDSFHPAWQSLGRGEALLAGYAVTTAVAFMFFLGIVSRAGAVYLGQVGYLVTLAGIGWGMLFFGERHGPWLWLAVAVVFCGVALVNFGPRRPGPRATITQEGGG